MRIWSPIVHLTPAIRYKKSSFKDGALKTRKRLWANQQSRRIKIGGGAFGARTPASLEIPVYITDIPVTTQEMADRVAKAEMERLGYDNIVEESVWFEETAPSEREHP